MLLDELCESVESGAYISCPDHQKLFKVTDVTSAKLLNVRLRQSLPPYEFQLLMQFPTVEVYDYVPNNNTLPIESGVLKELILKIKEWFNQQQWVTSGNFGFSNDSNHLDA